MSNISPSVTDSYLLAIGGGMKLEKNNPLITKFIQLSGGKSGIITILPVASNYGDEVGPLYKDMFNELCDDVEYYNINDRVQSEDPKLIERIKKSKGIFFTGGNQLRITSLIGGSPVLKEIKNLYQKGAIIAGTSAGGAAMSETMIAYGESNTIVKGNLHLSPGLAFLKNMVIDTHFVSRGRISRLLHLAALHPGSIGIGLSEDTGILIKNGESTFEVIGSRQVIIVDGRSISHTNIVELSENKPFSVTDVRVHVLGPKYRYNFETQTVLAPDHTISNEINEVTDEVYDLPYRPTKRLANTDW